MKFTPEMQKAFMYAEHYADDHGQIIIDLYFDRTKITAPDPATRDETINQTMTKWSIDISTQLKFPEGMACMGGEKNVNIPINRNNRVTNTPATSMFFVFHSVEAANTFSAHLNEAMADMAKTLKAAKTI